MHNLKDTFVETPEYRGCASQAECDSQFRSYCQQHASRQQETVDLVYAELLALESEMAKAGGTAFTQAGWDALAINFTGNAHTDRPRVKCKYGQFPIYSH